MFNDTDSINERLSNEDMEVHTVKRPGVRPKKATSLEHKGSGENMQWIDLNFAPLPYMAS